MSTLPIVIQSVNPQIPGKEPIIASTKTGKDEAGESNIQATTATDLAIGHNNTPKVWPYQMNIRNSQRYLVKKNQNGTHLDKYGIMPSNSKRDPLMRWTAKSTHLTKQKI